MPDTTKLRLAFIGGSLRSAVGYTHFVASTMDARWEIVAGCFSTDWKTNLETADTYGVGRHRTYSDWRQMLEKEAGRIDAVAVLTPTPSHGEIVTVCLEKGIPVICEKALASSSAEIGMLMARETKYNGFLAVTYNYTGYPMLRELRKMIDNGVLGELLHVQAEMPQEGFIRVDAEGNLPQPQPWRLHDASVPTIYLDLAVHLHQIVHYLTRKRPIKVCADQSHNGWFKEVVDNVSAMARYEGGMQGQFWFSKSALGHRNGLRIRVYGSKASAEWEQMHPEELRLSHVDGRREIVDRSAPVDVAGQRRYNRFKPGHPDGFLEAFANLYGDISDCLRQYLETGAWESSEVFGAELSLEGLRMLEAMVASTRSGKWESVESNRGNTVKWVRERVYGYAG